MEEWIEAKDPAKVTDDDYRAALSNRLLRVGANGGVWGGKQVLAPGVVVSISGLAKQPQYNGELGTILAPMTVSGRWPVEINLGADKVRVALKPENIAFDADCHTMFDISGK